MHDLARNNLQLILILALVALVGFPAYAMADITIEIDSQTKTTISLEKEIKRVNPFLDRLSELESKKMKATSDKERVALQAAQDAIIRHAKSLQREVSPERIEEGYAKASVLVDKILEKKGGYQFVLDAENYMPFTEIAYHPGEDAIKVGIHKDYVNSASMKKYADIVRGIVGDGVNIVIYNGGGYAHFDSCLTRTSDCSPMQAGILIGINIGNGSSFGCTLGFPATRNGIDGFITAGHCLDGFDVGKAVDQSLIRKVGELVIETFDQGSKYPDEEDCDCAFVKLTEDVTLDNAVFGISPEYYPDHVGTASVHDYVKMVGHLSGIQIGQVITTNATATVKEKVKGNDIFTTLKDLVKADYDAITGDSGGPIIEAFVASPAFLGSHTAHDEDGSFRYYVPYFKFESELGSITWGLNATQTPIAGVQNGFSTVESVQVVLDGSSSYGQPLETQIANYTWTQQPTEGAPDIVFPNDADKHTKYPTVTIPNVSATPTYVLIALEVTDEYGRVSQNLERVLITVEDSGENEFVANPSATDKDEFGNSVDVLSSSDTAVGAPGKHVTIPAASPLHTLFGYGANQGGNFQFITDEDDDYQSATMHDLNSEQTITITNNTDDDFIFTYAGSASSVAPILNAKNIKTALADYIDVSFTSNANSTQDTVHISAQIPKNLGLTEEQLVANYDDSEYDDASYIILINENADVAHLYDANSRAFLATEIRDTGGAYLIDSDGALTLTVENPTPESYENFGDDIQSIENNIMISVPKDKVTLGEHTAFVGAVYIFDGTHVGITSTPILKIENPDPNTCCVGPILIGGDLFGDDTAVSNDKSKIVIGVPQDYDTNGDEVGTAYIFDGTQIGTISTPLLDITSPNPDQGDKFGDAVAITANNLVAVGSPSDSSVSAGGAVYIFDGTQTGATNSTTLVIKNPDPTGGDRFGYALAVMNGDMLIVGAPGDDSSGTNTGSVYVFNATNTGITNSTLLEINNPYDSTNDGFGTSLYSDGDLIFVGAPDKTVNGTIQAGAVYVYDGRLQGTIHEPLFILNNDSPSIYDNYGESVSISGTSYAVGIPNKDTAGTDTGAMYSFVSNMALPTVPDSPTGLNATALSVSIIHLEWNEPSDNGGYQIRDYVTEYKESISNTWLVFDDGINTYTTTVVSGLADNTSYDFRVSAKNDLDAGMSSNIATESTPLENTIPVITLLGNNPESVELNLENYTDAGATAYDAQDGNLTASIIVSNPVDESILGNYTVTYDVTDSNNADAVQVNRTVNVVDTTSPVIALNGANPQTIDLNSAYVELGATVTDNDLSYSESVSADASAVDTSTAGSYPVTYNASPDASNNAVATVTRTVNVVAVYNYPYDISSHGTNQNSEHYSQRVVAFDGAGKMYAVSGGDDVIEVFDGAGNFSFAFGSTGTGDGQFDYPAGIAVDDGTGYIYVADQHNHRIQVFDGAGSYLSEFGSKGTGNDDFKNPSSLALDDSTGKLYIADRKNFRIQIFNASTGSYIDQFGSKGTGDGEFGKIAEIAFDGTGRLHVADPNNHRIQTFEKDGTFVSKLGQQGSNDGQFTKPRGLAFDSADNMYVIGTDNRLQIFDDNGNFLLKLDSGDTASKMGSTPSLALDGNANIYIADSGARVIHVIESQFP